MKSAQLILAALGVFATSVVIFAIYFHLRGERARVEVRPVGQPQPMSLAYGPLGRPNWSDQDQTVLRQSSPQQILNEFRWNARHPLESTNQRYVYQDKIDDFDIRQRALFYAVAERAPELITSADVNAIRKVEAELYDISCDGSAYPYVLSGRQIDND
jgi:hypothetical protein